MRFLFLAFFFYVPVTLFAQPDSLLSGVDTCKRIHVSWPLPDFSDLDSNLVGVRWFEGIYCKSEDCGGYVTTHCPTAGFCFTIVNRWGEVMFESEIPGASWCAFGYAEGTYFWLITGISETGEPVNYQGHFGLLYDNEIYPRLKREEKKPWFPTPFINKQRYPAS